MVAAAGRGHHLPLRLRAAAGHKVLTMGATLLQSWSGVGILVSMPRHAVSAVRLPAMLAAATLASLPALPLVAHAYDQKIAVLIGLSKYEAGFGKGVFLNLPMVVNDLEKMANALHDLDFGTISIYTDGDPPRGTPYDYGKLLRPGEPKATTIGTDQFNWVIDSMFNYTGSS